MATTPSISVLMPVYNGAEYLAESLDSILAQSFTDFEFIIIDDASTDATSQILEEYATQDRRIRILTNPANMKIAASLNRGLEAACAPLIARMDADDWVYPGRLAKQYAFMQEHPDVAVCGTWLESYETGTVYRYPLQDAQIRTGLLFDAMLAHPSVMAHKEVLRRVSGYDTTMPPVEDYDLWTRLAAHGKFTCLPEPLLRYRTYPSIDRYSYKRVQIAKANCIRERQVRLLDVNPSAEDILAHTMLSGYAPVTHLKDWKMCQAWGLALLSANARALYAPQDAMYDRVLLQWYKVSMATRSGFLLQAICHDMFHVWGQGPLARAFLAQSLRAFFVRVRNKLLRNGVPSHVDC